MWKSFVKLTTLKIVTVRQEIVLPQKFYLIIGYNDILSI